MLIQFLVEKFLHFFFFIRVIFIVRAFRMFIIRLKLSAYQTIFARIMSIFTFKYNDLLSIDQYFQLCDICITFKDICVRSSSVNCRDHLATPCSPARKLHFCNTKIARLFKKTNFQKLYTLSKILALSEFRYPYLSQSNY